MQCIHRFAVLGGDARLMWLVRILRQDGYWVRSFAVPDCPDTDETLALTLLNSDCVILPIPAFRGAYIHAASERSLPLSRLMEFLHPGMTVFGGRLAGQLSALKQTGATVYDYAAQEQYAAANAVPTAEGAIQIAMEQTPHTIQGSACLVIGFGRIGKVLARKLACLGARVSVAARSEKDLALIAALGYTQDRTGRYDKGLDGYDLIFNTVPAPVLDASQLASTQPNVLLIDLSSQPGGIDLALCKLLQRRAITGWQLPGKVAPATAGRILADTVLSQFFSS